MNKATLILTMILTPCVLAQAGCNKAPNGNSAAQAMPATKATEQSAAAPAAVSGAIPQEANATPTGLSLAELQALGNGLAPAEAFARLEAEGVPLTVQGASQAVIDGREAVVVYFTLAGGDLNALDPQAEFLPPLHVAANTGRTGLAEFLLQHGAELELADNFRGCTPYLWAAAGGSVKMLELLEARGARTDVASVNEGLTAVHLAAYNARAAALAHLLKHAHSVDSRDKDGATPMIFAARCGSIECLQLLLDHGADVNAEETEHGFYPLLAALYMEQYAAADFLLEQGADPKVSMKQGQTAATLLAAASGPRGVEWLVKHGMELNTPRSDSGATALMLAAGGNSPEAVQMLLDNGADLTARDKEGHSALDWAVKAGRADNAAVLEKALLSLKHS